MASKKENQVNNSNLINNETKSNYLKKAEAGNSSTSKIIDTYKDLYKFKKGHAFIFNHSEFLKYNKRENASNDCEKLEEVLKELDFDVEVYIDLKYSLICEVLCEIVKMNHSEMDCVLIVVMSHGDNEVIQAYDRPYSPTTLWEPFTHENCPTLAGKPKLIFIQVCRGERINGGGQSTSRMIDSINLYDSYKAPTMSDVLVVYSIYPGLYSFGSINNGSLFVHYLCRELKCSAKRDDIITILTSINRRIADGYENYDANNAVIQSRKLISIIVSTLRKRLYLLEHKNN